ncbi:hypothetical protein IJ101_02265, partial [Candidatus Saccharibacteria bacterium]|nr:hypothetical protein [Candidatus Saccharibacteria bacterium]
MNPELNTSNSGDDTQETEKDVDAFLAQFDTLEESSQGEKGDAPTPPNPEATNATEGSNGQKPERKPTFSNPELHDYELKRIEQHLGQSALIATRLNEDDRKNVMAEAIDLKAKQDINKSKVKTVLTRLPIVGSVVRAGYMSKYKKTVEKAINEHSNLSDAYEALGLNVADSQVINSDNEAATARAQQILENGFTDKDGNKYSRLDSNDRIEKVNADTQAAVKTALNEYYAGLKNSTNKEELNKAFEEQISSALVNEKDAGTLKDAIMKQQANLEKLAKDDRIQADKVEVYLNDHLTLYSATMKEGLYTKKKVDAISAAVVAGGLAGGVIAALSTREISKAVRGVATAAGTTNIVAGAAAGGITGAIRGWQKAGVKLSDAEIKATAEFAEPSAEEAPRPTIDPAFIGPQPAVAEPGETNPESNPDAANSDKAKKKAGLFATLDRLGKKATGEEKYTQEINELRKRKSANSLISELDDLISQGGPEDRQKLEDLYAEIRARGQLSADKNIDLIIYGKDEAGNDNRSKLEQKLAEAELALFGGLYGDQASISEKLQMPGAPINDKIRTQYNKFLEDYNKARDIETKFRLRSAAVNGIMGAVMGAGAGAVLNRVRETETFQAAATAFKDKLEGAGIALGINHEQGLGGKDFELAEDENGGYTLKLGDKELIG